MCICEKTYFDVTFFAFKWIEQPALWNLQSWGFISAQCLLHLNSGNSWKLILPPNWFNGVDWYYFERIAFLEKNNKLIQPLLAQPSSSQHQQQQPQRPHNFLPFLRPQNSIQTKKRERKFKEVNQCQTSTTRQQVSTPVLGVLCRSLYIDKANSIGTISSRRGSQRGGKWEAMDMFLRNFRPGSSSTRNKSKRTQILARKRVSNRMHCCSRGAIQHQSQSMLSSRKPIKQVGFQTGTCF